MDGLKLIKGYVKDGWALDGWEQTGLRESEIKGDSTLGVEYEYVSITVSLKRKRDVEGDGQ